MFKTFPNWEILVRAAIFHNLFFPSYFIPTTPQFYAAEAQPKCPWRKVPKRLKQTPPWLFAKYRRCMLFLVEQTLVKWCLKGSLEVFHPSEASVIQNAKELGIPPCSIPYPTHKDDSHTGNIRHSLNYVKHCEKQNSAFQSRWTTHSGSWISRALHCSTTFFSALIEFLHFTELHSNRHHADVTYVGAADTG